jgi:hypothetical protein
MRPPKMTIAGLMVSIVAVAGGLAAYQSGRRHERAAIKPPPIVVYVTRSGERYHRTGCRYLRGGGVSTPVAEARVRYSPCLVCMPPP